jgi:hypothetical protein
MGTAAEGGQGLVGSYGEMEEQNQKLESLQEGPHDVTLGGQMKRLLWHGGSVYDAWFSAASNQVDYQLALLTDPLSQLQFTALNCAQEQFPANYSHGRSSIWPTCYTWLTFLFGFRFSRAVEILSSTRGNLCSSMKLLWRKFVMLTFSRSLILVDLKYRSFLFDFQNGSVAKNTIRASSSMIFQ